MSNETKDYSDHRNAWINPEGEFFPVKPSQHGAYARSIGSSERILEINGWVKISTCVHWHAIRADGQGISKRQLETIFDFCVSHEIESEGIMDSGYLGIIDFRIKWG